MRKDRDWRIRNLVAYVMRREGCSRVQAIEILIRMSREQHTALFAARVTFYTQ